MAVKIDTDKCTGCGACVECCPTDSLSMNDDKADVNADNCIDCGVCVDECPAGALAME